MVKNTTSLYGNVYIDEIYLIKGDKMKHYEVVCALIEDEKVEYFAVKEVQEEL